MNFNSGNFRKGLSNVFDGMIWKLLLHESTGLMAIETRNAETRNTCFSLINFPHEKINFLNRRLEQAWNLTLFYLSEEHVLLNSYKSAETPETQGLICLHAKTGDLEWEKYNISPDLGTDKGIRVFDTKIYPRKYYWIDYSGNIIESQSQQLSKSSLLFPVETTINEFPTSLKFGIISGTASSLKHRQYHIYSFHEVIDNKLRQRIVVTQGDSILLDDILIADIQNLQPEAFFIQNDVLYYIRNKRELVSYFL